MTARRFDCVVIGCGPAGLMAAKVAADQGLQVVGIDRMGPGGQLMNLGELHGVAGAVAGVTGPDFVAGLAESAMGAGAELAIDEVETVTGGDLWSVKASAEAFEAPAVIVASGLTPGTTGLAEESEFAGRGLSHCATCDAPLFKGKPVVVVGRDAWAVEEAIELARHASSVALVGEGPLIAGADRLAALGAMGAIRIVEGRIAGFAGIEGLESVHVVDDKGSSDLIPAQGLFPLTQRKPARAFLSPVHDTWAGLFWAGDVQPGVQQRINEAIADGVRAGHNAVAFVRSRTP